ncbi:lysosomal phospholipase A and acyltransferase [Parasteatoda tepidariorum]|uniref:lysosomal phospholipase A and acyltransferase n=1 Tax=Parasteatoda tepidariorum TaxID=114398 RepID=UPI00077FAB32|nr:phospholipase A2 group XV [Parasteatoda tepidariorum]
MVLSLRSSFLANVVLVSLLVFIFPLSAFRLNKRQAVNPSPVILVPGDGGSQLEAKLDKPETVHYFCNKKTDDFFSLWLNLELLVPYVVDCWVDNMRLVYDNNTRTTSNAPGVSIRVPDFGNTSSVDWLDPSQISPSSYFINIIQMLVAEGYTRGLNIRGAPYDFRKAPNEMTDFFNAMKNMTEETYEKNAQTKVTFVCHSMGCPLMSYFFNQQTQQWKDKHIKAMVTLGGAWGGAVKAIKTFAAGENLGVFVISQINVRREQRTSPSLAYVMPSQLLWKDNEVMMITDKKNYTKNDFYQLFQDIDFPDGYEMYKDTLPYALKGMNPPGVEIHCMHGINVTQTIEMLDYRNTSHFPDNPKLIYGDGDGTVNVRSLEACLLWQGKQKQKIYHTPLNNVDHMGILADLHVLDYIKHVIHM